ncbi:PaaI family thioesterase [Sandaracinobacteroides saxicola]|nr:PaaI family thioesterase [Sandaracinobacteroides saxicola]
MSSAPLPKDALASMSGLELMQAMASGALPRAPIGELMGFNGMSVGDGWVEFFATPTAAHYNPIGTVHGGFAATLLDSCMACAVHTRVAAGFGYTTVDLNITYLKAMTDATGRVTARGEVISASKRIATARGSIVDAEGRLLATGTTTCLVFPLTPRGR